jgi:anti-sigma regulatory factor (Ser/Thr protein kinase)
VTASGAPFAHEAIFYDDLSGFLSDTLPFLREGVDAAEAVLVAVEPVKADAMRTALDDTVDAVQFVDMADVGRNPGRLISTWADIVDGLPAGQPLRGIGEPIWPGRRPDEIAECHRHESLLNLAFAYRADFVLMCPYDRAQLDEAVLDEARHSHPRVVEDGESLESQEYDRSVAPYAGSLAEPTGPVACMDFASDNLGDVRRWVADAALAGGLARERADDLALAVGEAATNSLCHAGGHGELRRWWEDDRVVCEVHDEGRIRDPLAGRFPAAWDAAHGRGLWLIHQLCDLVQIRSSEAGSVVRMQMGPS